MVGSAASSASGHAAGGATSPEQPWPVGRVARRLAEWVARLGSVWVEGQITQVSHRPGMPWVFLTLRDPSEDVSLRVLCPRAVWQNTQPAPEDGARVVLLGRPQLYPARGTLALIAAEIRAVGLGELLARLERLKGQLAAEGLFAAERKRRLPFLPNRVGLVTGRASAAERDVVENARRRWPAVRFEVREVAVQGPGAVAAVIAALAELDAHPQVDVIVLARGGGAVEDLLPFSNEALVRAVAAARTPVVSAVGHEQDTPLVDLVADVRASTPTDAARRIVPDMSEEAARVRQAQTRLRRVLNQRLERERAVVGGLLSRPCLADPFAGLAARSLDVNNVRLRGRRCLAARLENAGATVRAQAAAVRALSPAATLERGYAVVQTSAGTVVRAARETAPGQGLQVRLAEGALAVTVAALLPVGGRGAATNDQGPTPESLT